MKLIVAKKQHFSKLVADGASQPRKDEKKAAQVKYMQMYACILAIVYVYGT